MIHDKIQRGNQLADSSQKEFGTYDVGICMVI